jgi:hypothetical protein
MKAYREQIQMHRFHSSTQQFISVRHVASWRFSQPGTIIHLLQIQRVQKEQTRALHKIVHVI